MIALGTFTFAIFLYFVQIGFMILTAIYILITLGNCKGKKVFNELRDRIFFNNILGMAIEGMIEFLINGYLNAMTA